MYHDQLQQHEAILREAQKTSHHHAQAVTKLEMLSATRKQVETSNEAIKMELAKTKVSTLSEKSEEFFAVRLELLKAVWNRTSVPSFLTPWAL